MMRQPQVTVHVPRGRAAAHWAWTEITDTPLGRIYTASVLSRAAQPFSTGATAWQATVYEIGDGWAYSIEHVGIEDGALMVLDQVVDAVAPFGSVGDAQEHVAQWSPHLVAAFQAEGGQLLAEADGHPQPAPAMPVPELYPAPIPAFADSAGRHRWCVLTPYCAVRFSASAKGVLRLLVTESSTEDALLSLYPWKWSIDAERAGVLVSVASGVVRTAYAGRQVALAVAAAYESVSDALRPV